MTDTTTKELTISFQCPVCGRTVEMTESQQHNLTSDRDYHGPTGAGTPKHECPVYFRKDEPNIRQEYEFIRYEIPTIFINVPEAVTDHDVFRSVLDSTVTHRLGVTITVTIQNREGERTGYGLVHGWYHGNKPSYYGVVRGLQTPQNVIVTGSRKEFAEFLEKWFYFNREYAMPDEEYRDFKPDPDNTSLEDF